MFPALPVKVWKFATSKYAVDCPGVMVDGGGAFVVAGEDVVEAGLVEAGFVEAGFVEAGFVEVGIVGEGEGEAEELLPYSV